jgi:hypothetical protein
MPAVDPTSAQRQVLELLTEFTTLTTQEIGQYLGTPCGARALRALLRRVVTHGWVGTAPCDPARGAASARYWWLTVAGARALALPGASGFNTPSPAPSASERPLSVPKQAVLALLADWRQLTTSQIWQALYPAKTRDYMKHLLHTLAQQRLIGGAALQPEQGAVAEYYWWLRPQGAALAGVRYGKQFRRRPTVTTIRYRGLHLALIAAVAEAGWTLLRPVRYNRTQPRPAETAHGQQLVTAVLAQEGQTLTDLFARGYDRARLQERIARYQAGQVGALVPPGVNEYVAYLPDQPQRTLVLIPHPPAATRSFWTRHRAASARPALAGSPRDSRLARFARLARVLPIIGVFDTEELAAQYAPLLEGGGFRCVLSTELAAPLRHLAPPVPGASAVPAP